MHVHTLTLSIGYTHTLPQTLAHKPRSLLSFLLHFLPRRFRSLTLPLYPLTTLSFSLSYAPKAHARHRFISSSLLHTYFTHTYTHAPLLLRRPTQLGKQCMQVSSSTVIKVTTLVFELHSHSLHHSLEHIFVYLLLSLPTLIITRPCNVM